MEQAGSSNENLTEQTLSSRYPFTGRVFRVRVDDVRLPNGHEASREVVEHTGGVCIAPLTDAGELLFVRQWRHPFKDVLLELPAGKLEKDEDPLTGAVRELKEEVGAVAARIEPLGRMLPSPGYCSEVIHLFLATGLTIGDSAPDEDEFLEAVRIPLDEAVRMVLDGEIPDAKTQLLVLKTAEKIKK
ncbi:MAG: NUDIX hydrolase [Oscillospiraceae bacterium]|nr:NUDIX hydrolase [Oscillospiraceae bacterium]